MPKKISTERKLSIIKFCKTHPKTDAIRLFNVSPTTVTRLTKGINWKKKNNEQEI